MGLGLAREAWTRTGKRIQCQQRLLHTFFAPVLEGLYVTFIVIKGGVKCEIQKSKQVKGNPWALKPCPTVTCGP